MNQHPIHFSKVRASQIVGCWENSYGSKFTRYIFYSDGSYNCRNEDPESGDWHEESGIYIINDGILATTPIIGRDEHGIFDYSEMGCIESFYDLIVELSDELLRLTYFDTEDGEVAFGQAKWALRRANFDVESSCETYRRR